MKRILLVCMMCTFALWAIGQGREVTGVVTGADDNLPIPGVNILVKGTSTGSVTDMDGKYSIKVPGDDAVLVFSYIGFLKQEVPVEGRTNIDVEMSADVKKLEEVVVTAFGIEREKKALGYAVTEVQGDELNEAKEQNFVNSLSGKVPGLQVSQTAGGVGGSSRVVLRGFSSLTPGNNGVLFIVDGVPVNNATPGQAGFAGGRDLGSPIADINPEDIESISVLKGANAAALYGAAAQNGVVMITTKKGAKRKGVGIQYNSNLTFENPLVHPELQNEYGQGLEGKINISSPSSWGAKMEGQMAPRFDGEGEVPYVGTENDYKEFFRTGRTWINSLSASGGTELLTYRFSYANTASKSIVPGSNLQRNAFTLRASSQLTEKFSVDGKLQYTLTDVHNRQELAATALNVARGIIERPRSIRIQDLDEATYREVPGRPGAIGSTNWGGLAINPYYAAKEDLNQDKKERYVGLLTLRYDVTDWFTLQARGAQDYSLFNSELIYPIGANPQNASGVINTDIFENITRTFDALGTVNKNLSEEWNVFATAGVVANRFYTDRETVNGSEIIIPRLFTLNNVRNKAVTTTYTEKHVNSLYGSGQIGYRNALFLEVTGRNDWSSALPVENSSFFYPSVTLSGVLTDLFQIESSVLNYAKLRGSWAKVGNDTQPYRTRTTWSVGSVYKNGTPLIWVGPPADQSGYEGATYGFVLNNPNLLPESTTSIEFGGDLWFFDKRLMLDATYYNSSTENQIIPVTLPRSTGITSKLINAGKVRNKGVELLVSGTPIQSDNFSWNISVNFARNVSTIESLTDEIEEIRLASHFNNNIQVFGVKGKPYGVLRGSTYWMIDGKVAYQPDGRPHQGDIKDIGNATPDFLGGITNSFSYKGVNFSFLLDAKIGGDIYSFTDPALAGIGNTPNTLEGREYYSGGKGVMVPDDAIVVDEDGNPADLDPEVKARGVDPRVYWQRVQNISEHWVYDASFVKLRQLTLSYALPKNLIENTPFTDVKLGYVARNLAILYKSDEITNFDPESNFSSSDNLVGIENFGLPTTRSHGVQLSVKF